MSYEQFYKKAVSADGYGLSGTVVPKTDLSSGKSALGLPYDIQQAYPHNVIIGNDTNDQAVTLVLTDEMLKRLQTENRGKVTLTYDDLLKAAQKEQASVGMAKPAQVTVQQAVATPQPARTVKQAPETVTAPSRVEESEEFKEAYAEEPAPLEVTEDKVKVTVTNAVGHLSFYCNSIFRHNSYLVMLQHSADGSFYEFAVDGTKVKVTFLGQEYECYVGPQVPVVQGSAAQISIFILADE